jgi:hypothetical protein
MNLILVHNNFFKLKPHIDLYVQYLFDYNMVKKKKSILII